MVNIEPQKIGQMFDYLNPASNLSHANGALVFGRKDPLVASRAAEIMRAGLVDYALVIGGIGKDSGALTRLQIPEAHYLVSLMLENHQVDGNSIYVEPRPTNGGECWEKSIETLLKNSLPHNDMTVVIHPTSLRRIMAQGEAIMKRLGFQTRLQGTGTNYSFNPENLVDQREAVAEMLRLADWPAKGWSVPRPDLPAELVQVARDYDSSWKAK